MKPAFQELRPHGIKLRLGNIWTGRGDYLSVQGGCKAAFHKDKSHNDLMGVISSALNATWGGSSQ